MKYTWVMFACILLVSSCQSIKTTQKANLTEPAQPEFLISGIVLDVTNTPIAGAVVRIRATEKFTMTDKDGEFTLTDLQPGKPVFLTAWAEGYYIGGGDEKIVVGSTGIEIILEKITDSDNPAYQWVSAFAEAGSDLNCENCHAEVDKQILSMPFTEWSNDAHSASAQNIRFLTMYLGQDIQGNQSPQREYAINRDYGRIPILPDLTKPYFGPGYKLDFPETAGNCSACHVPVAAINAPYDTDPTTATGVGVEGVACDFCHKVWDIRLDPMTGLPQHNMPGVLSFEFRRPDKNRQFFAGPFDDVPLGDDTYTPIQQQSQFCAPCHFGSFWNTQIYNSYGEWLESSYSDPVTGKTCQDCHMPVGENDHFARLDKGGVIRDPRKIFSHLMPGASNIDLLQNAVTMTASAKIETDKLIVDVQITNDKTGHHVPTDSPLRQMILLVNVADENGQPINMLDGETVPEWGGVGDPNLGYYASLPGKGFAKILSELWTELEPTGSYWNPTRVVGDNRIAANESNRSMYIFSVPLDGKASIKVSLLFRRAFKELADQKGWVVPDILMEQQILNIER